MFIYHLRPLPPLKKKSAAREWVESIAIAPDGTVWFGSNSLGLASFDGQTWKTYKTPGSSVPVANIHTLAFAPDGALWVGAAVQGLARYQEP